MFSQYSNHRIENYVIILFQIFSHKHIEELYRKFVANKKQEISPLLRPSTTDYQNADDRHLQVWLIIFYST